MKNLSQLIEEAVQEAVREVLEEEGINPDNIEDEETREAVQSINAVNIRTRRKEIEKEQRDEVLLRLVCAVEASAGYDEVEWDSEECRDKLVKGTTAADVVKRAQKLAAEYYKAIGREEKE